MAEELIASLPTGIHPTSFDVTEAFCVDLGGMKDNKSLFFLYMCLLTSFCFVLFVRLCTFYLTLRIIS
jgi:hypothetical protein